jgi:hypothetical protein
VHKTNTAVEGEETGSNGETSLSKGMASFLVGDKRGEERKSE